MLRLSREVRFNLVPGPYPATGGSGHAGTPAVDAPAVRWTVRVTLGGDVDPATGYLIDVKRVDEAVRTLATPVLRAAVDGRRPLPGVAAELFLAVRDAWPGRAVERVDLLATPQHRVAVNAGDPGMVELSHHFEFSAAHRLHSPALGDEQNRRLFGKCNNPDGHGHNYEVRVTLAGTPDGNGMLLPVAEIERIVEAHAIGKVDHKHLNLQVDAFRQQNPSVENIARTIHHWLAPEFLKGGRDVWLKSVTVWETPKTFCEYTADRPGVSR